MRAPRLAVLSALLSLAACDDDPQRLSNLVENRSPLPDVSGPDAVVFDTTPADTAPPIDTTPVDTAPADTAPPPDTTPADTTPADTTPADTTPADTTPADTTPADTTPADTTPADTTPADTTPADTTGPTGPIDLNTGFIGGACDNVADCDYANAYCMPASDGWENGMCSQDCTSTCPDRDGLAVTFCIDGDAVGESGGMCVQKCDLGKSESGCRAGYTCADELRNNTSTTAAWTCLPGEWDGCLQTLMALGVEFTLPATTNYDSVSGVGVCDVFEPVRVSGTINGVDFHPSSFGNAPAPMYVQCGVALALWETAELAKTRGITDIAHYGTYNCRVIAGTSTLSEHAFANAIDIAGIELATGERYTVLDDWEDGDSTPDTPGGEILYWFAHEMHDRRIWNIILTPEYNAAHDNHFHVDLTAGSWFLSE